MTDPKQRALELVGAIDELWQNECDLEAPLAALRLAITQIPTTSWQPMETAPASFGWQPIETIPDVENCQLLVRHSAGYFALIAQVDGDWLDSNGVVDLEDFTHWTQVIEPEVTP